METKNITTTTDENGAFQVQVTVGGGPGIKVVSAVATAGGGSASADVAIPDRGAPTTTSAPATTQAPTTTPTATTTPAPATVTVINNSTPVISFVFFRNPDNVRVNVGLSTGQQSVVDVLVNSDISITNNDTAPVFITGPGTNTPIPGGGTFQYTISNTTSVEFIVADI